MNARTANPGMPTDFAPKGAVTGIGSLPFRDSYDSVEFVERWSPAVPFWPQLPARNSLDSIAAQALGDFGDPGFLKGLDRVFEPREGGGFDVAGRHLRGVVRRFHEGPAQFEADGTAGWRVFLDRAAEGAFDHALALKGQIVGPWSLASLLHAGGQPFAVDARLLEATARHVGRLAANQARRLGRLGRPVLVFLDEPLFATATPAGIAATAFALDEVRRTGALAGLHSCLDLPLDALFAARPNVLSFDADRGLDEFVAHPEAREFVRRGWVAYGLVPATTDVLPAAGRIVDRLVEAIERLAGGGAAPSDLARRTLVTGTCGLGDPASDVARAEASFRLADAVAKALAALG